MTALRKELREAGIEFKVLKNTLTILAAEKAEMNDLIPLLTGPTAFAFGYDDPVAAAKIISEFARRTRTLRLRAAFWKVQYWIRQALKAGRPAQQGGTPGHGNAGNAGTPVRYGQRLAG